MSATADPHCTPSWRNGLGNSSGDGFHANVNPLMKVPPSPPTHHPKVSLPHPLTLGIGAPAYEFAGNTDIQTMAIHVLWCMYVFKQKQQTFKRVLLEWLNEKPVNPS